MGLQNNIRVKAGLKSFNTHGSVVHFAFAVGSESRKKVEDRMSVGRVDLVLWPARGKTDRKQKKNTQKRVSGTAQHREQNKVEKQGGRNARNMMAFLLSFTRWLMEKKE
jgi:hypothetical protein